MRLMLYARTAPNGDEFADLVKSAVNSNAREAPHVNGPPCVLRFSTWRGVYRRSILMFVDVIIRMLSMKSNVVSSCAMSSAHARQ